MLENMSKVVVIDYDIGNVKSIINALNKIEVNATLTRDRETILSSDAVILPGVGAFKQGMTNLKMYNLDVILKEYVKIKKPLLGICLGMQLLFDESEEFGLTEGLGLINGKIKKLTSGVGYNLKLPNIGWYNVVVQLERKVDTTLFNGINNNSDFYFVHTFAAYPDHVEDILSTTSFGDTKFCSSVKKDNIYGCQFHPEKSGEIGLRLLNNFVKLIR